MNMFRNMFKEKKNYFRNDGKLTLSRPLCPIDINPDNLSGFIWLAVQTSSTHSPSPLPTSLTAPILRNVINQMGLDDK
ncbi:hypothetical protein GWI33_000008 [Rhynchophorus ferrugineus]|uniref:Uncharacterized protein n=1 Tax=Rhynchophorus ferrugineus TaxID=354439 RepID=A0A834IY36_RHYFE|nr:hypothetical protein GWI33_000008 [Rhynchophorus ferrugineus]